MLSPNLSKLEIYTYLAITDLRFCFLSTECREAKTLFRREIARWATLKGLTYWAEWIRLRPSPNIITN